MAIDLNDLAAAISQLIIRFRIRRNTSSGWLATDEILLNGEIGYETDRKGMKIGDGVTAWAVLAYFGGTSEGGSGGGTNLTSENAGVGISIDTERAGTAATDDAHWTSRSVLLHFDGTEGQITTVDSGPNELSVLVMSGTGGVSAYITDTDSKFGGASSFTNTSHPGWQVSDDPSLDFGSGDFTIEGWFKVNGSSGFGAEQTLLGKGHTDGSGIHGYYINALGEGDLYFWCNSNAGPFRVPALGIPSGGAFVSTWTTGNWNHVAVVRHGTTIHFYINGIENATSGSVSTPVYGVAVATGVLESTADSLLIGKSIYAEYDSFWGYEDEIRISTRAEYTANFTPPVAAFPGLGPSILKITNTMPDIPGSGGNLSPDTHPETATAWDDEFEYGTGAIDTTGARFSGANAWTVYKPTGTTAATVSHGMLGANYGQLGVTCVLSQPLPVGDCMFVCKVQRMPIPSTASWSLGLMDAATGKVTAILFFGGTSSSATIAISNSTLNLSTGDFTGNSNAFTAFPVDSAAVTPAYLRIRRVGTNTYYGYNCVGHEACWFEPGVIADSAWTASPTHVVLACGNVGTVDWFRRVA